MKTLTIAASRLLRYHETKGLPCFAADIIGQGSFVSLENLDRVYSELVAEGHLTASESKGKLPCLVVKRSRGRCTSSALAAVEQMVPPQ